MGQAVEAEAPDSPPPPPLRRDRIERRRLRHVGVEGGVEASHVWHVRHGVVDRVERSEGLRLVERGEIAERLDAGADLAADDHRPGEVGPPLDDAVAHGPDPAGGPGPARQLPVLGSLILEAPRRQHGVAGVEDGQLQTARACIDNEDPRIRVCHLRRARPSPGWRGRPRPRPGCRHGPAAGGPPCAGARARPSLPSRARGRSRP